MPLVPEPFSDVIISRQSVFLGGASLADIWAKFRPNLNIPQYRESLSDEKKDELDKRATRLKKRAICNHFYSSSESSWEVSAWNDVFGLLYDDERFRMDKRPYEFLEVDEAGNRIVKKRIPDATIGLKSYDDFFLKRGYICNTPDCKEDHSTMQPDERLSEHALRSMMYNAECGLVVDGVWGKTELLFPFAVYEAKKRVRNYDQAEDQIYHACRTYLAMLDDLARNPDNVAEYQTEESSKYQLFALASCGSYWQVFIATNMLHGCMVQTIWEGDVKEWGRAFDLICIVDQIQDYAVHHHRPFVMKHLEAWHNRHKKTIDPVKSVSRKANATTASMDIPDEDSDTADSDSLDSSNSSLDPHGDLDMNDFDLNTFNKFAELVYTDCSELAEWHRLKLQSDITRREISNETRRRNQSLREAAAQASESTKEPKITPARGRPPKTKVTKTTKAPKQVRPRGRPPKANVFKTTKLPEQVRPRGRPPKAKETQKRKTSI